jgi:hypothetical protein
MTSRKTIAAMVGKVRRILTGWGKAWGILPISTAEHKLSELRMGFCNNCSQAKTSKVLEILSGKEHYTSKLVCTKCKCPCLEKSLVTDEKCPIGKW